MANIQKAMQWLKEGKKVRRPIWQEGSFWELSKDRYERIVWSDGRTAKIYLKQLEEEDWEIYEKEFDLSEELEKWFERWNRKIVTGRCLIELKQRDKRFVERLREECTSTFSKNIIDELAGKNLQ